MSDKGTDERVDIPEPPDFEFEPEMIQEAFVPMKELRLVGLGLCAALLLYVVAAFVTYAFRHPEVVDMQGFWGALWEVICWR